MSGRLYDLLPQLHRLRDAERGQALQALLAVLEGEIERVQGDIDTLYDSWFIETCPEWVVPYLGDLVKASALSEVNGVPMSRRAYVANTLAHRRRKGTAPVLEQVARDVTGWPARCNEHFQQLVTCQHVQHLRRAAGTVDVRNARTLELSGGPFEETTHLVDVHNIDTGRGRYNVPNMGISLWRLQRLELLNAEAAYTGTSGQYHLCPLQVGHVLLNKPETEAEITHFAEERNVPGVLRARALAWELDPDYPGERHYFNPEAPSVAFAYGTPNSGSMTEILPENIEIGTIDYLTGTWPEPSFTMSGPTRVLFDPDTGRVTVRPVFTGTERLYVTYGYAAPAELGGGPYDRSDDLEALLPSTFGFRCTVTRTGSLGTGVVASLQTAVSEWNTWAADPANANKNGLITIEDNGIYDLGGIVQAEVRGSSRLVIAAAKVSSAGEATTTGLRPWLRGGPMRVAGIGGQGSFVLHGVVLEGRLQVESGVSGGLQACVVSHSTLRPVTPTPPTQHAFRALASNPSLTLTLHRSVVMGVRMDVTSPTVTATDCILGTDSGGQSLFAEGTDLTLDACTVVGEVKGRTIEASNSLFLSRVDIARRQEGCVRYSFIGLDEHAPRRYRCQPDLAVQGLTDDDAIEAAALAVAPRFRAVSYVRAASGSRPGIVDPDYYRLSNRCPVAIREGADDGGEMGVFHHLAEPHRRKNLTLAIADHMRTSCVTGNRFQT